MVRSFLVAASVSVLGIGSGAVLGACGGSVILLGDAGPSPGGQDDGSGSPSSASRGGEDAGGSSGSSSGSGSGSTLPMQTVDVCPTPAPPAVGTACAEPGQGCAYYIGGSCQAVACDGTGHWQAAPSGC